MDPSHDNKVEAEETEEFSSNESGWTKYIASPGPEHNFSSDVDDGDEANHDDMSHNMDDDDHDDHDDHDSIASDASSGPAHHILPYEAGTIEDGNEEDEESCNYNPDARKKEAKERGGKARKGASCGADKIQGKKNKQGDK